MPHALAPAAPVPTLNELPLNELPLNELPLNELPLNALPVNELHSREDGAPVTLGYTPDQMPVVIWPRGDDPVLEVGCVQIRLFRLTEGLRAGLAECLERSTRAGT